MTYSDEPDWHEPPERPARIVLLCAGIAVAALIIGGIWYG